MKKEPMTREEAIKLHAKFCEARDKMADACDWAVRHYKDKRTRKAIATVWRHFSDQWFAIADVLVDAGASHEATGVHLSFSMRHLPKKMKPTPTIDEHVAIADMLGLSRNNMLTIYIRLARAMRQDHRAVRASSRAHTLLSRLTSRLDDLICAEHPKDDSVLRVYYGRHNCMDRAAKA